MSARMIAALQRVAVLGLLLAAGCSTAPDEPARVAGATFPHPAGWERGTAHGAVAREPDGRWACTNACHGVDSQGGLTGLPCDRCHRQYPHPEAASWLGQHGQAWLTDGAGRAGCTEACHGPLTPAGFPAGCLSCHDSYPHPAGWAQPQGHGAAVAAAGTPAGCTACHSRPEQACSRCHADYPHAAGWAAGDVHGQRPRTSCTGCHGADLAGGGARVPCNRCHPGYPHPDGWGLGHRGYVQSYSDLSCGGTICHADPAAQGRPTRPACTDRCHRPATDADPEVAQ